MIKNLAFKGGGVRGIAFVGALRELEKNGFLSNVARVAGSSAGALVASMYSLQYSVNDIFEMMQGIQFKEFDDAFDPIRIVTHYGLYKGNYILEFAENLLVNCGKGLTAKATFGDLKAAGCKDLYVFATNLNTRCTTEFSADCTPGVYVAEAIRASMSIPIFFRAWQFSNGLPDNDIYVDGGLMFNYPLSFFDDARFCASPLLTNIESLGFYLRTLPENKTRKEFGFDKVFVYAKHLFESMLNVQDQDVYEDGEQVYRSVVIDDLGLLATDFDLTAEDINNLVASGEKAANEYYQRHQQGVSVA